MNKRRIRLYRIDQIGALISAHVSANNRAIEEQTRSLISANNQVLFEAMRAIEERLVQSINRLREELGGRLAHVERRLDLLEARFNARRLNQ